MAKRTIIVGDVHGMLPELKALIEKVGLTKDDHLVFCGDLVDKGPDSAGVVRHVRELREEGFRVTVVKGNHEDKHERFRRAFAKAGDKVQMRGLAELKAITEALDADDVAFLDEAVLFLRLPEHNALVVHAGVLPSTKLPKDLYKLDKHQRSSLERIMRVRHVTGVAKATVTVELNIVGMTESEIKRALISDLAAEANEDAKLVKMKVQPKGSFIGLGNEGPGDTFWPDAYDGRFGHVFFGHSPFPDAKAPMQFPEATGLDLGAVFGGRLAAAVLVEDEDTTFVSVKAGGKFAKTFFEDGD